MKLQVAIATALATEVLADSSFPVQTKTNSLTEIARNRIQMNQVVSELNLAEGNDKKNRAPQEKVLWEWQQSLDEAIQEQRRGINNSSEDVDSNADALDLGILGASVPEQASTDHRRLQVFDFCDATMEEIREQVFEFSTNPNAVNTDKFCEAVIAKFGPEVCNECGSTFYETGEYSLKIDCPGLVGKTKCKNCMDNLVPLCEEKDYCDGCGPLCGTCGDNNGEDWFVDNQNCLMTYDMRVANEIDKGTPVDLDEAVDFVLYDRNFLELYLGFCEGETLVSIEDDEDTDSTEEKEEEDAQVASSGVLQHSPMSTIHRFAWMGASWIWMAI